MQKQGPEESGVGRKDALTRGRVGGLWSQGTCLSVPLHMLAVVASGDPDPLRKLKGSLSSVEEGASVKDRTCCQSSRAVRFEAFM